MPRASSNPERPAGPPSHARKPSPLDEIRHAQHVLSACCAALAAACAALCSVFAPLIAALHARGHFGPRRRSSDAPARSPRPSCPRPARSPVERRLISACERGLVAGPRPCPGDDARRGRRREWSGRALSASARSAHARGRARRHRLARRAGALTPPPRPAISLRDRRQEHDRERRHRPTCLAEIAKAKKERHNRRPGPRVRLTIDERVCRARDPLLVVVDDRVSQIGVRLAFSPPGAIRTRHDLPSPVRGRRRRATAPPWPRPWRSAPGWGER
jgi:hypothetical protein